MRASSIISSTSFSLKTKSFSSTGYFASSSSGGGSSSSSPSAGFGFGLRSKSLSNYEYSLPSSGFSINPLANAFTSSSLVSNSIICEK